MCVCVCVCACARVRVCACVRVLCVLDSTMKENTQNCVCDCVCAGTGGLEVAQMLRAAVPFAHSPSARPDLLAGTPCRLNALKVSPTAEWLDGFCQATQTRLAAFGPSHLLQVCLLLYVCACVRNCACALSYQREVAVTGPSLFPADTPPIPQPQTGPASPCPSRVAGPELPAPVPAPALPDLDGRLHGGGRGVAGALHSHGAGACTHAGKEARGRGRQGNVVKGRLHRPVCVPPSTPHRPPCA